MATQIDAGQMLEMQKDQFEALGMKPGPKCCSLYTLAVISATAVFIIGCIGAAGAFPSGPTMGWTTMGLSGVVLLSFLAIGELQKRKFEVIVVSLLYVTYMVLGVLGGAGVLSATQVGWGVLGTMFVAIPLSCVVMAKNCLTSAQVSGQQVVREVRQQR